MSPCLELLIVFVGVSPQTVERLLASLRVYDIGTLMMVDGQLVFSFCLLLLLRGFLPAHVKLYFPSAPAKYIIFSTVRSRNKKEVGEPRDW